MDRNKIYQGHVLPKKILKKLHNRDRKLLDMVVKGAEDNLIARTHNGTEWEKGFDSAMYVMKEIIEKIKEE